MNDIGRIHIAAKFGIAGRAGQRMAIGGEDELGVAGPGAPGGETVRNHARAQRLPGNAGNGHAADNDGRQLCVIAARRRTAGGKRLGCEIDIYVRHG